MFMMEKSVVIIICIYAVGFAVYAGQYLFADPYGFTITNLNGVPIKNTMDINGTLNIANLNTIQANITATAQQRSNIISNPLGVAGGIASELFLLLTGLTVFNLMLLLGIPAIIVAPMIILYAILLGRTIIGYIRGI